MHEIILKYWRDIVVGIFIVAIMSFLIIINAKITTVEKSIQNNSNSLSKLHEDSKEVQSLLKMKQIW